MSRHSRTELTRSLPEPRPGDLGAEYFGGRVPFQEQFRPHFGRSLDLTVIESAIQAASIGLMRRLTDLGRETISLDGHCSALLQKRLNRLAALDWQVTPASGPTIDEGRAKDFAAFVDEQLQMIPNFRERVVDLAWGAFDGRAASEIEWNPRGKWFTVKDLHWIHPRRLSFDRHRRIRVIDSSRENANFVNEGFPVEEVPNKFLVYRPRQFGDYQEREGLAWRTVYWSFFMRFGTRERLILMELFGKPWRIGMPKTPANGSKGWNDKSLKDGFAALNALGFTNTAMMPPNVEVMLGQPAKGAGEVHDEIIKHAEATLSKLYLGSTGTTDAVSTGLGSSIGDAHLSEEDLIIVSDARRIGEAIENGLTDAIIAVNFGSGAISHAPSFTFSTDPPRDRKTEGELIQQALDAGMRVSYAEVQERLGIGDVADGDPFIQRQPRNLNGAVAYPPQAEIVWPKDKAPPQGQIVDIPFVAGAYRVGERPPPIDPNAEPLGSGAAGPALPSVDDGFGFTDDGPKTDEAIDALAAKMTADGVERCRHGHNNRCWRCGIERIDDYELGDDGGAVWSVKWRPIRKDLTAKHAPRLLSPVAGLPSEGGSHWHALDREANKTQIDGQHSHVFEIGGQLVETEPGGAHGHRLEGDHLDTYLHGGAHAHWLVLPDGSRVRTEVDGHHGHEALATHTAQDGMHCHSLVLPDGSTIETQSVRDAINAIDPTGTLGIAQAAVAAREHGPHCCLVAQPRSTFGSPSDLVKRGALGLAVITEQVGSAIVKAVQGKTSAKAIRAAIDATASGFSRRKLAGIIEGEVLMGLMLGALDANYEAATGEGIKVESFTDLHPDAKLLVDAPEELDGVVPASDPSQSVEVAIEDGKAKKDPRFTRRTPAEAVKQFQAREVVTRDVFDEMTDAARRRAFTVAGAATDEIAATVKSELANQIKRGADLRKFAQQAQTRLAQAGWTPDNPSHVETVFRTNVQNAYNSGRFRQMTQPAVMAARPYIEILTVNDGPPRQRLTHQAVHGTVVRADDPALQSAYPPFGFNCFVPGTKVSGRFIGASRALYRGKLVELTTAKGRRLTVTADHPVLTPQGFFAAQSFAKGEELLGYRVEPGIAALRARAQGHEHDAPSTAQQVFRALEQAGGALSAGYRADDFHGEASRFYGQIQVVGSYRELTRHAQAAAALEQIAQFGIESPRAMGGALHGGSHAGARVETSGAPPGGFPSLRALTASQAASLDALPFDALRLGAAAHIETRLADGARDDLPADLALARELLDRSSGEVFTDQVVDVRQYNALCHVFDLETETGWLEANGIITANCRCRARTISKRAGENRVVDGSVLQSAVDQGFTSGITTLV